MNTRRLLLRSCAIVMLASGASHDAKAQVVPATPKKFTTRDISGGASTGTGTIGFTNSRPQTSTVRTVSYIALGDSRQWKSADGKSLLGKLIAFEDLVVETKIEGGSKPAPAALPPMPEKPTVVRNGRARLLIDNKPFEVALDRLSEEDRKLVESINAAVAAKGASVEKK